MPENPATPIESSAIKARKSPTVNLFRLFDRRSAAHDSADWSRPCPGSMPPDGNQGQFNQAVAGPLQRHVERRLSEDWTRTMGRSATRSLHAIQAKDGD